ncbi:MAG: outer membrane protein transport protein [Polyangiales bacterium]
MRLRLLSVALVLCLWSSMASANTDINGLFDARSTGMGATGVAFIDSAAAIPINPAALDQIGKLALTLDATMIISQPQRVYVVTHPEAGGGTFQNYETIRFDRTSAVLPFLGGAYRIHERVVIGAGVYPLVGSGTTNKYRPAPELRPDLEVTNRSSTGLVEVGVPVSVRILDNLSLAAMWRATYLTTSATTPLAPYVYTPGAPDPTYASTEVSGWNFGGFEFGLLYKPVSSLRLGLTYRSKVVVEGTGTINAAGMELDAIAPFANPHSFRAGAAFSTLEDRLLLAADFKYLLYGDAFKTIDTIVVMNGMESTRSTQTNWMNAFSVHLGAEYALLPIARVRAGYSVVQSATPKDYADARYAPPGYSHAFTLGFGVTVLEKLSIDLAGVYIAYQTRVETKTPNNAGPGLYGSNAAQIAASATFRL